jgi:hypothetical protein
MVKRLAAAILLLVFSSPVTTAPTPRIESHFPQKSLQILIEGEDPVMIELFGKELQSLAGRAGRSVSLITKEAKQYDLRIFFSSGAGSKSGYCTRTCSTSGFCSDTTSSVSCSCNSCSVTVALYFSSAVVLKPDGTLQSVESGVGITRAEARTLIVRKLVSML